MWLLGAAPECTGVHTAVFGTQLSDLEEEVFYHHLFLLYTEVDICAKKNNLGCYVSS